MICRGGVVEAGRFTRFPEISTVSQVSERSEGIPGFLSYRKINWLAYLALFIAIGAGIFFLPGRTAIAPQVESDYCYLLTAADRMYEGLGATSTPPVAPHQSWEWRGDWAFLTQWPVGYPLLIFVARNFFSTTTLEAVRWINVVACAMALVGWFAWIRRCVPPCVTGTLLSAVASGSALSVGMLVNPSTDLILIALTPIVLLVTLRGVERDEANRGAGFFRGGLPHLAAAGFLCGALFWIRYASVFLPAGISAYLIWRWIRIAKTPGRGGLLRVMTFALCAAGPMWILLWLNSAAGESASMLGQMNLGDRVSLNWNWRHVARAWWMFTDFGFYQHHSWVHVVFAAWPVVLGGIVLIQAVNGLNVPAFMPRNVSRGKPPAFPSTSRSAPSRASGSFLRRPQGRVSVLSGAVWDTLSRESLVICMGVSAASLVMLVAAVTLFGSKFDYVGLERYYRPIQPLYFAMFVGPVLVVSPRILRALACVPLVMAGSWTVQQEWGRRYESARTSDRPETPSGFQSRCFEPGAAQLFRHLSQLARDEGEALVVVSNFHEFIEVETQIPALPIPPDETTLRDWVERIGRRRELAEVRVLFALNPDNQWRTYWIADVDEVKRGFQLRPAEGARTENPYVFIWPQTGGLSGFANAPRPRVACAPRSDLETGGT